MIPYRDDLEIQGRVWMTFAVIVGLVFSFAVQPHLSPSYIHVFFENFGMIPVRDFENVFELPFQARASSFVSAVFFHEGAAALLVNAYFLWLFGRKVEDELGPARWLILFLAGGIVSGLVTAWLAPRLNVPIVGAAGGVAAVMGAYLSLAARARMKMLTFVAVVPIVLEIPALVVVTGWFLCWFLWGFFWSSPIFVWANFVAMALGAVAVRKRRSLLTKP